MQEVYRLIVQLKSKGITIELFDNNLKLKGVVSQLTKEEKQLIIAFKPEIIEFLKEVNSESEVISIHKLPVQECYDLSPSQYRLWVLSQLDDGSAAYNMPSSVVLDHTFDIPKFKEAVCSVVDRHEILRTVFRKDKDGQVKQWIKTRKELNFQITHIDYTEYDNAQERAQDFINQDFYNAFDLENGPLLKVVLFQLRESYIFYTNMHHIISDGWSNNVLYQDTLSSYKSLLKNKPSNLPELRIQYKEYAAWKLKHLDSEDSLKSKSFWLDTLSANLPVLDLPSDKKRPKLFNYKGHSLSTYISTEDTAALNTFCKEQKGSLFMGLLAIWNVLSYRYTNQTSSVIGTPVSGRNHSELNNQIGFYVNSLALRNDINPRDSFLEVFESVKVSTLNSFKHQDYPMDALLDELEATRDVSRNAIFDAMLVLQDNGLDSQENATITKFDSISIKNDGACLSKLDIVLNFEEVDGQLKFQTIYYSEVYELEMISRLMNHFKQLLKVLIANNSQPIKSVNFLTKDEEENLLVNFNTNKLDLPKEETLVSLFTSQVEQTPNNIAVFCKGKTFSYAELDRLSNLFAAQLQQDFDVANGDIVGVHLSRSEWVVISILGILKTGAAYVPIDLELPITRKENIIEDADIKLLISEEIPSFKVESTFQLHTTKSLSELEEFVQVDVLPSDPAYIIYTSGSTGKPKGVLVEHTGIVNTALSQIHEFQMDSHKRKLQFASFSFDASVWETFITLLSGSTLYVVEDEVRKDAKLLEAYIKNNKIEIATLPPSYLQLMDVAELKGLEILITAGEAPVIEKVSAYLEYGTFYNAYGPTETSVCGTSFKIEKGSKIDNGGIPIGGPIANAEIFILNEENGLQPIGISGEICIGGAGLARGYMNLPQLTSEKFIDHPFKQGERLYKTGDIGKWLETGDVVFLGRKDEQLKVNGHRIELDEITYWLTENEAIKDAAVIGVKTDNDKNELAAYIVSDAPLKSASLRNYLLENLPAYMLPKFYFQVEDIPLTINGKVDKKALLEVDDSKLVNTSNFVAPITKLEKRIAAIWQSVLGHTEIGLADDFFQLGGHSINATELINEYAKEFDVKVKLADLFTHTTVQSHVVLLDVVEKNSYQKIAVVEEADNYSLSSSQYRLWILSQFEGSSASYNMPSSNMLEIEDVNKFKKAIQAVVSRHEILRTVFRKNKEGEVKQWVREQEDLNLEILEKDFRDSEEGEAEALAYVNEDSFRAFDLEKGPLLRVALLQLSNKKFLFYYNMHHIISDGKSMEVLSRDVQAFYESFLNETPLELPKLPIQYKDYAFWQSQQLLDGTLELAKEYWTNYLSGTLPILNLPSNNIRPKVFSYQGRRLSTLVSAKRTIALKEYCKKQEGTLFMGLLSLWNVLFYKYTNQKDIIIGSPVAGRGHADLIDQIGFYINTLAHRNQLESQLSFNELFSNVKKNAIQSYEYQQYPFDELLEELQLMRDLGRSPVFDILLTLQNTGEAQMESELTLNGHSEGQIKDEGSALSQMDISIDFVEVGDRMYFQVVYNNDVYEESMVQSMMLHFQELLDSVLSNPEEAIGNANYLITSEQEELLHTFNNSALPIDENISFIELFQKNVALTPNKIAVQGTDIATSYRELDELSNKFASYLKQQFKLEKADFVVINTERDTSLLLSILAIFKLGCTYIPVDPSYPEDRKQYILNDSKCNHIIDDSVLKAFREKESIISPQFTAEIVGPKDLAYVIYTSGSTGHPKGVMIEHIGMMNHLYAMQRELSLNADSVIVQNAPYTFDISVWQLLNSLIVGGTTSIYNQETVLNTRLFLERLEGENTTILQAVPSYLKELLDTEKELGKQSLIDLQYLLVTGEAVSKELVSRWFNEYPDITLVNAYGPAEASDDVTLFKMQTEPKGVTVPVGTTIDNMSLYILDDQLNLCAKGVVGEICVSGIGLSPGYLNRPELTKEKFVPHPYKEGERLYRTGDLGKINGENIVEFIDRKDNQVKVNGHRIELGEIEHYFLDKAAIEDTVVLAHKNDDGLMELAVYFESNEKLDTGELREYANSRMPFYMVPRYYIQLEKLPLTPNGKIDRKGLPHPKSLDLVSAEEYITARNDSEVKMTEILAKVLKRDVSTIGVFNNFFDLGMNSLKLFKLGTLVNMEFETEVKITSFFEFPSINEFVTNVLDNNSISVEEILEDLNISEEIDDFLDCIEN